MAVGQPILEVVARHPTFLVAQGYRPWEVAALPWALVLVPPGVLLLGLAILAVPRRRASRLAYQALLFLGTAFLFLGALVRCNLPAAVLVVAVVAAGAVAVLLERFRVVRLFLQMLVLAAVIVPLVFLADPGVRRLWSPGPEVPAGAEVSSEREAPASAAAAGPETPVLVLILDELGSSSLLNRDGGIDPLRFPGFARLSEIATFYPRTRSAADTTELAVPAMLSGRSPQAGLVPVARDHPVNLFTALSATHRIQAVESLTRLCPRELNRAPSGEHPGRWAGRVHDLGLILLHRVLPREVRAHLPTLDDRWEDFGFKPSRRQILQAARQRAQGDRPAKFEAWLEGIHRDAGAELHFLHLLLPHRPWEYLPDGRQYNLGASIPGLEGARWEDQPFLIGQAFQRYLWQLQYLDSMVVRFLDHLKATGLLERSLVAVAADHGVSFRPGDARRLLSATNLEDIAVVPMWIKAPGQGAFLETPSEGVLSQRSLSQGSDSQGSLAQGALPEVSPGPGRAAVAARTLDLFPTILDLLGLPVPDGLDGWSLREPAPATGEPARFFTPGPPKSWTPRPDGSDVAWLGRGSVALPEDLDRRLAERVGATHEAIGSGADPLGLYRAGPAAHLVGRPVKDLDRGVPSNWRLGNHRLDEAPREPQGGPRIFRGTLHPIGKRRPCCRLAFAVRGKVWATMETWKTRGSRRPFAVFLPPEAGSGKKLPLQIFEIRGPGRAPTLHRIKMPPE